MGESAVIDLGLPGADSGILRADGTCHGKGRGGGQD
jgi:hypothetical protein